MSAGLRGVVRVALRGVGKVAEVIWFGALGFAMGYVSQVAVLSQTAGAFSEAVGLGLAGVFALLMIVMRFLPEDWGL